MRLNFHPLARDEFKRAVREYEFRQRGLGARFASEVERAIDRIRQSPVRWPLLEEPVRRCLTQVFPYAVLYSVEPDGVFVVAVMHCHRKPGYWRDRVHEP
jgi:toxin ParE1/3/4